MADSNQTGTIRRNIPESLTYKLFFFRAMNVAEDISPQYYRVEIKRCIYHQRLPHIDPDLIVSKTINDLRIINNFSPASQIDPWWYLLKPQD